MEGAHFLPPQVIESKTSLCPPTPLFRHLPCPPIVLWVPCHISQHTEQIGCGLASLQSLPHHFYHLPTSPSCTGALRHLLPHLQPLIHLSHHHTVTTEHHYTYHTITVSQLNIITPTTPSHAPQYAITQRSSADISPLERSV